jgi:hypothetical protein
MSPRPGTILLALLLALIAGAAPVAAQIPYTGGTFNQNFNSLITSGTAAWQDNATVPGWFTYRTLPCASATILKADNGSNTGTGVVYSYGMGTSPPRAFGILPGSTPGNIMWGACFLNDTGATLTSFNLTYDGEQWRAATTAPRSLQVAFQVGQVANLNSGDWTSLQPADFNSLILSNTGALNGTLPCNSTPGLTYSVGTINWPPGTELWIRWESPYVSGGCAALAINNVHFSASNTSAVDPFAMTRQEAIQSITDLQATLAGPAPDPQTRELTMCAYAALALNIPNAVAIAENFLQVAFQAQLPDGTFPENIHDGYQNSVNWTQFTMLPIGPIFLRYGPLLDGTFVNNAMPYIQAGLQGAMSQSVSPTYTNIYTMQLVNMMLVGQVTGNNAAQEQGFENLNAWISSEQTAGLGEFDSPTYSIVDYGNLLIGENNTSNPMAQARLIEMLNYFSADMCANFVNGFSGNLGGAHSRDYNFPIGDSAIEHFYYYAGVRLALPDLYDYNGGLPVVMNRIENGYSPSPSISAIAASSSRIVRQIWGPGPGQDRYTYICPDYTIGSTSSYFGPQDKQIAATLPTPQQENQIVAVYDNFDAPYGVIQVDGKPVHLTNAPATVQNGATILSLSNLGPQFVTSSTSTYTSLATNFTFPGNAGQIYLDGNLITSGSTVAANLNSVLGVRVGNALVAMKAFQIDGYGGYTPAAYIKFDGPNNAARFVYYHYQGPAVTIPPAAVIRSGLFLSATSVTTNTQASAFLAQVANTSITPVLTGSTWSASATFSGATLAVSQNTSTGAILCRKVNGANYTPSLFVVSTGTTTTDYAAMLLDPVSTAPNQPPAFAAPATAAQNPAASGSVTLSSLGADDGGEPNLTYTWSVTGSAPGSVTFSSNGSNASKNSVATFTAPGTYNLQVVDTDVGGLTGTSSLPVTVSNCFGFWQAANFTPAQLLDPSISGDAAAPAGDGISNLMKYALNLNPWQPGFAALPTVSMTGSTLRLTYKCDPTKTDLSYLVLASTDLNTWTSTGVNQGIPGPTVTASVPMNGNQQCFLRLQVTGQ